MGAVDSGYTAMAYETIQTPEHGKDLPQARTRTAHLGWHTINGIYDVFCMSYVNECSRK